jgi:hypothetical protein
MTGRGYPYRCARRSAVCRCDGETGRRRMRGNRRVPTVRIYTNTLRQNHGPPFLSIPPCGVAADRRGRRYQRMIDELDGQFDARRRVYVHMSSRMQCLRIYQVPAMPTASSVGRRSAPMRRHLPVRWRSCPNRPSVLRIRSMDKSCPCTNFALYSCHSQASSSRSRLP